MNDDPGGPGPVRGICCSAGGIRSAAFSLGALQEMSRHGKLEGPSDEQPEREGAQFLAGVSGGSYIASAFTLATRYSDVGRGDGAPRIFAEGSPEETFLRNRCSYLAAGLGGKLRLVATIVTNFLANLLFIAALLWVPGRLLGWLYANVYPSLATGGCEDCDPLLPIEGRGLFVLRWALVLAAVFVLAIVLLRMITSAPTWRSRLTRWAGRLLATLGAAATLLLVLPQLLVFGRSLAADSSVELVASNPEVAAGAGLTAALAAAVSQVGVTLRNARSLQKEVREASTWYSKLSDRMQRLVVFLAASLAGPLALLLGLLLIIHSAATTASNGSQLLYAAGGAVFLAVLYRFADLTAWSLHPFYKQRLASAFAVKRVTDGDGARAREIPYADPLLLSDCSPEKIREHTGHGFPELIICAAANISDGGETPPGSAVASFVFSPRLVRGRASGKVFGEMRTDEYEHLVVGHGETDRRRGRLTVPAAVAISGAAIAPSMGKMTRGSLRFLLALANLRLGVWLPNLARREDLEETSLTDRALAPAVPRPANLLKEVVGRHRLHDRFLYVTDGGHYENLGLVELLHRGCTEIYCFDASTDESGPFAALGEAIALARTDAGVEIDIEPEAMLRETGGETGDMGSAARQHVIGSFTYRDGTVGRIAYVRATVTPDVPWDVRAYAKKDKVFPANPTTSQLYTGERFEAYRVLGVHGARAAIAEMDAPVDAPPGGEPADAAGEVPSISSVAIPSTSLVNQPAAEGNGHRRTFRRRRMRSQSARSTRRQTR